MLLGQPWADGADEPADDQRNTFTLWQLPPRTPVQHMAYVLRTAGGKVIVVDGGNRGDAEYLRGFLAALGDQVDAWFLSHPHPDHAEALIDILNEPGSLRIETIYGSLPDVSWVQKHEPQHLKTLQQLHRALDHSEQTVTDVAPGDQIDLDGVQIRILGARNPEITGNAINNSSLVFRVADSRKSVLFTGDLGVAGGRKLMQSPYREELDSDYVQMAHHGQAGVDRDFYEAVRPRFCLWPTPAWLWNNDNGNGIDSGSWQTLIVRGWMNDMNVEDHYLAAWGLVRID